MSILEISKQNQAAREKAAVYDAMQKEAADKILADKVASSAYEAGQSDLASRLAELRAMQGQDGLAQKVQQTQVPVKGILKPGGMRG